MNTAKKEFRVLDGAWTEPSASGEKPQLIGSKCGYCGEIFFPKKPKRLCSHCEREGLEDVKLSKQGKINTFTVVMQMPGGGNYYGPAPYAIGTIELPEGVYIDSPIKTTDFEKLKVGIPVELVIEKIWEDNEGNELIGFKFETV